MGLFSNKIGKDELKKGDHIYTWRVAYAYSHHGIYAGEGKVIHFRRPKSGQKIGTTDHVININNPSPSNHPSSNNDVPCPKCGLIPLQRGLVFSCMDCFLVSGDLYRFEYGVSCTFFLAKTRGGTCSTAVPDPPEHVLHRANFLIHKGFGVYDLFNNNCEDFAIYCKTGLLGRSGQAASLFALGRAVCFSLLLFSSSTTFIGPFALGYGMYCLSRLVHETGASPDVAKVPARVHNGVVKVPLDACYDQFQLKGITSCKKAEIEGFP